MCAFRQLSACKQLSERALQEEKLTQIESERDELVQEVQRLHGANSGQAASVGSDFEKWYLEETVDEHGTHRLRDAAEMVLFTDDTQERWPRPLRPIDDSGMQKRVHAFLAGLDDTLRRSRDTLKCLRVRGKGLGSELRDKRSAALENVHAPASLPSIATSLQALTLSLNPTPSP